MGWACLLFTMVTASVSGQSDHSAIKSQTSKDKTQMNNKAEPEHKHTNLLINATSPYLLQHAHNPVDWNEWGEAAFEKARREDKPIFLSIGYAACHWCHVMEHETFESELVADQINGNFVCIKVDREERPDIDEIYMAYTQNTTGGGGWPMSVWLTPEGTPFYAGTYFPRNQFLEMCNRISTIWDNDREQLLDRSGQAKQFFAQWSSSPRPAAGVISHSEVDESANTISRYFDRNLGGMRSSRNKFPPSMAMDLMLRVYRRSGDIDLLEAVDITLDNMARGGIYDHLGGGICRYSTDSEWLVPHFEKMLYDQGMVSAVYLDGFQATRNKQYADLAADIFDYVMTDLQSPEGGFYSSRDADSEGLEGAFYIWQVEQIKSILGEKDGQLFCDYYDVSPRGNWFESRGHAPAGAKNILHIDVPAKTFAQSKGVDLDDFNKKLKTWRKQLLKVRAKRIEPGLDDKILTGWNGLMIAAMAKGGRVLNEPRYTQSAARAADFILKKMCTPQGRLLRSHRNGKTRLTGYLSDYAFFTEGLLYLYEATFDRRWLNEAVKLTDFAIQYYFDEKGGGFFFTAKDGEKLIVRSKHPHDGAIPSGNSVQALNLLRMGVLLDRKDYREKAESILRTFASQMAQSPGAYERLACAADFYHDKVKEIAIIGDPASPDTQALIRTVFDRYLPNKVVVQANDKVDDPSMPLLKGKARINGKATAYVCENYRCQLPVTTPEDLAKQLEAKTSK